MNDTLTALALAQLAAVFDADWSGLERLYAHDVCYCDPDGMLAGRSATVGHLRDLVEALPGCGYQVRRTYSDGGDGVVVEWTLSGAGAGDDPPISLDVVTAYDYLDEHIVSERNYWDTASLRAQMGMPSATPVGQ